MGEISETMTTKKKKKGRPSLLELQKRSLKQQRHQNPNSLNASFSTSHSKSTRHNPSLNSPDCINDDDDERKEKKHKLLFGLNSQQNNNNSNNPISSTNSLGLNSDGDNPEAALKKPRISATHLGSDEMGEKAQKATDSLHEAPVECGPTTPLPDKKLLVFILDRLQKKDTYGVFSDPVDPEELPDYHDIIEHPMDFSTVRKKLEGGVYANLEQFEKDVFLICSNAMQYNSPDTIYFRQARSMQELAKKDFENLRQDSDGEPQPKIMRRGRPPGKVKKSLERSPLDRVGPECSSDATLATGGDNTNYSTGYNLRRTHSYKYKPTDVLVRTFDGSHNSETYASWISEWENEFPASVLKAVLKYGKKPFALDENRRDTYKQPSADTQGSSNLNLFGGERRQLMTVGLNSENGYARSLARFAANLGPNVWKIASKKIEKVLPAGLEFGPGWVGQDRVVEGQQQQLLLSDRLKVPNDSAYNDHLSNLKTATGTNLPWNRENMVENIGRSRSQNELSSLNSSIDGVNPVSSMVAPQKPVVHSDINNFNGGPVYNNCSPLMGTARLGIPSSAAVSSQGFGMVSNPTFSPIRGKDLSSSQVKLSETSSGLLHSGNPSALIYKSDSQTLLNGETSRKSSWQGSTPYYQEDFFQFPPDLNVGFLAPNSPSSSIPIGSPQQPDLALQL